MSKQTQIDVTIGNYRCFSNDSLVSLSLESGRSIALVGKNNVGKSTLMRFFYEFREQLVDFWSGSWNHVANNSLTSQSTSLLISGKYGLSDLLDLYPTRDTFKQIGYSFQVDNFVGSGKIIREVGGPHLLQKQMSNVALSDGGAHIQNIFKRILYIGAHRNLVNQSAGGGGYFDMSVGSSFVAEWDVLKNGTDTESANVALQAEAMVADLLGWDSISLNKSADGQQLYLTRKGSRYALSELGAGISELILCLVTAAIKKPSWVFIDEPESHLHPALQIKFVAALEQLASEGVVFSTHSIGLARTCADKILYVQQDKAGASSVQLFDEAKNFSELMGELSFSQFHELGFNKLLLCEGVTEIKTLRQFLRLWKLDASVLIVPLGGDALINPNRQDELAEFKRFGVEVFVLIDSERESSDHTNTQRDKFIAKCKRLFGNKNAMQTDKRAIENYFTRKAIRAAMRSEKYDELSDFEHSKDLQLFWGKNQNWRVAAQMEKSELEATDVGLFFKRISESQQP
jgi:ABC-type polar amino acid transport system ATPase subunit